MDVDATIQLSRKIADHPAVNQAAMYEVASVVVDAVADATRERARTCVGAFNATEFCGARPRTLAFLALDEEAAPAGGVRVRRRFLYCPLGPPFLGNLAPYQQSSPENVRTAEFNDLL